MANLNDLMVRWFGAITTDSDGNDAGSVILKDAGTISGITNMGTVTTPVDANATPPAGQSQVFNTTIKKAVFNFYEFGAVITTAIELRVVFGALNDADALTKLTTDGQYASFPVNGGLQEFPFPDAGGAMRMDFATDVTTGTNSKVAWEVTL